LQQYLDNFYTDHLVYTLINLPSVTAAAGLVLSTQVVSITCYQHRGLDNVQPLIIPNVTTCNSLGRTLVDSLACLRIYNHVMCTAIA